MPELAALVKAVEQNNALMSEVESDLTDLKVEISNLPDKYLPREEAKEKALAIRNIAVLGAAITALVGLLIVSLVLFVKAEGVTACKDDRAALRDVINIAVADRQPLSTSTPETIAAIEESNERQVRPLRERLLSLDGTQPEKC